MSRGSSFWAIRSTKPEISLTKPLIAQTRRLNLSGALVAVWGEFDEADVSDHFAFQLKR